MALYTTNEKTHAMRLTSLWKPNQNKAVEVIVAFLGLVSAERLDKQDEPRLHKS
jgi:hypothetical protein